MYQPEQRSYFLCLLAFSFLICGDILFHYAFAGTTSINDQERLIRLKLQKSDHDSTKIFALLDLAHIYFDIYNDKTTSDSLSDEAIEIAGRSKNIRLQVIAFTAYTRSNDLDFYHDKALKYVNSAIMLAEKVKDPFLIWQSYKSLTGIYLDLSQGDSFKALKCSQKELQIATQYNNKQWIVESALDLGQSLERLNLKMEALKNYLNAADLAENIQNKRLMILCYSQISSFYRFNTLIEKAWDYKIKQFNLVREVTPCDSMSYMWIVYDTLSLSFIKSKTTSIKESQLRNLIDYSIRTENHRLKQYTFALCRTYFIENENINPLKTLYYSYYPSEFSYLALKEPDVYLRLKAFFMENEEKTDSAIFYFNAAEKYILQSNNPFLQSNFNFRLGQFFIRQNKKAEAIRRFRMAYDYANKANINASLYYLLAAIKPLEKLYLEKMDYPNAYYFSKIFNTLMETRQSIEKKEQVVIMDLNNTQQKRELENLKEKQRNEQVIRNQKNIRNMMAGGIGLILIVLFFIYRNYRNQKRSNILLDAEKRKSDNLLLNILPQETAEELKQTGSAKARRIEKVTVMFTDFKDFTIASEKMEAEELVRKIDYYFSEFDRIISKYNVEKIKIIGDSYMCAGGLPVSNDTHPYDVVRAAIDFQCFMRREREECLAKNKLFFELRIGIHTGPVVAGIVGLKKFAYDIWGDTVNTASRMESSGEVNKVNISGTTYELIREKFICTYRGKVSAKNKGEIDMYFVEKECDN
jgi:class 3 adenylate cyclase